MSQLPEGARSGRVGVPSSAAQTGLAPSGRPTTKNGPDRSRTWQCNQPSHAPLPSETTSISVGLARTWPDASGTSPGDSTFKDQPSDLARKSQVGSSDAVANSSDSNRDPSSIGCRPPSPAGAIRRPDAFTSAR